MPHRTVRRVLVVDDEQLHLEKAREWMPGREVLVESDETKVLERVRSADPDLVILDLFLHGANGRDLAFAIKAESPGRPVVVISAGLTVRNAAILARPDGGADLVLPKQGRRTFDEILAFVERGIDPDPWDEDEDVDMKREVAQRLLARSTETRRKQHAVRVCGGPRCTDG